MNTLKEMEREFKNAIGDIQKHPEHINKYDLVGLMKKIEERSFIVCSKKINNIDILEAEKEAIINLSKINKSELMSLKSIIDTIFDVAITH
jgi:hypothetical protein